MKTSNKILSTAFAAYLLFTAGNSAAILKEYKRAQSMAGPRMYRK